MESSNCSDKHRTKRSVVITAISCTFMVLLLDKQTALSLIRIIRSQGQPIIKEKLFVKVPLVELIKIISWELFEKLQ